MTNDVFARLAAANPVPAPTPQPAPRRIPLRHAAIAGLAVAVAVPAIAFAGRLGDVLGISNEGTPVSTTDVLPGLGKLDEAMRELRFGSSMQYLGALNGVSFYATRNADGDFCLAIDHVNERYEKGVGCLAGANEFPSSQVQALAFPGGLRLQGVAADGVATVEALDANGSVLDSTPVVNNLFVSEKQLPEGAAAIRTLDAQGNVLSTQRLPGR